MKICATCGKMETCKISGGGINKERKGEDSCQDGWVPKVGDYNQEALDEMVHEVMADKAASINNEGPAAQVAFLLAEGVEQSHVDAVAGK